MTDRQDITIQEIISRVQRIQVRINLRMMIAQTIIRKLSDIRKKDRYISFFVLVWRTTRCYTVLYRA